MILFDAKKINAAWQYEGIVQCRFKSKLSDKIFIHLPVASEALMNVPGQLMVKNRVMEHIQANATGLFHG